MNKEFIERKGLYSVYHILSIIKTGVREIVLDGDLIRLTSVKWKMFSETDGLKCAKCGMIGMYFSKERDINPKTNRPSSYYLRLYGLDENGNEILMTKDHKNPRAKGGGDLLANLQTMCIKCNHSKGCKFGLHEGQLFLD